MWPVWALLLLRVLHVQTEECPNTQLQVSGASPLSPNTLRRPRASPVLTEIIGLSEAKATLQEAVVLPASLPSSAGRLFWRSSERSAVLLAGPSGLGLEAAAEAAAAAIGAQVLRLLALEAASGAFCSIATAAANSTGGPVVVIIESLEAATGVVSLRIRECLAAQGGEGAPQIFVVATTARDVRLLGASALAPFGYVARLGLPSEAERKQYLLKLFAQISRVDAQWASALREAAVATLANLTATCTFADIDLLVRRAFLRSTSDEGARDPVALHHFEKILEDFAPRGYDAFLEAPAATATTATSATPTVEQVIGGEGTKPASTDGTEPKKKRDVKDPMDGIFGWCNFWLPEALHLSPVVWAMIIFGVLAHFMARSTYQPYNSRKKRSNAGRGGSSLWGDLGGAAGGAGVPGFPSFNDNLSDWYPGGAGGFPGFPPQPPGMPRPGEGASSLFSDTGPARAGTTPAANSGDAATGTATQPTPETAPPATAVPQEAAGNSTAEPAQAPAST